MPVYQIGTKRVLYIHVPKTGGTSVEALLRSYGVVESGFAPAPIPGLPCTPQHFHAPLLEAIYGNTQADVDDAAFADFDLVFMTVRNPLHRVLSEYRHQRTLHANRTKPGYLSPVASSRPPVAHYLAFRTWLEYALLRVKRDGYFADNHLRPQWEFATETAEVYRLEDGLDALRERLDLVTSRKGKMPAVEKMKSTDVRGEISEISGKTARRFRAYYERDFERFGY